VIEHQASVPSYYLRYYYLHDEVLAEQRQSPSRADEVAAIEKELLDLYGDPSVVSKPEALSRRGGALYSESAVQLASALLGTRPGRHVVNARNGGKLRFLPDDAVVEVPADVSQGRIELLQVDPLPAVTRGLISAVYAYEELALDAAVLGGRERVLSALMAHPLIGQWEVANTLTDRILLQNREYLAWAR
jgi:6-phospho-beta-glucosidase